MLMSIRPAADFSRWVCRLEDQPLTFRDPPPPLDSQSDSELPVAKVSEAANISSTPFTPSAVWSVTP